MDSKKIKISGIAVREGLSKNNRLYTSEELHKFAPSMIGKPLMLDHEGSVKSIIGKITNAESIDKGKMIKYEAWIKGNDDIIEKIKDKRVDSVSIGAFSKRLVRDKDDENVLIPIDMEALELSLVAIPGVTGTSINPKENYEQEEDEENESEEDEDEIELKDDEVEEKLNSIKDKKEDIMESEQNSQNESAVVAMSEFTKLKEDFEAMKETAKSLEDAKKALEEARRQDAINSYTERCKGKKIKALDLSKSSMEAIQLAINMVDGIEVSAEVEKTQASPKSKEVANVSTEDFSNYVIENSTGRGVAFFKYY
jgi:hypothetical protein